MAMCRELGSCAGPRDEEITPSCLRGSLGLNFSQPGNTRGSFCAELPDALRSWLCQRKTLPSSRGPLSSWATAGCPQFLGKKAHQQNHGVGSIPAPSAVGSIPAQSAVGSIPGQSTVGSIPGQSTVGSSPAHSKQKQGPVSALPTCQHIPHLKSRGSALRDPIPTPRSSSLSLCDLEQVT